MKRTVCLNIGLHSCIRRDIFYLICIKEIYFDEKKIYLFRLISSYIRFEVQDTAAR